MQTQQFSPRDLFIPPLALISKWSKRNSFNNSYELWKLLCNVMSVPKNCSIISQTVGLRTNAEASFFSFSPFWGAFSHFLFLLLNIGGWKTENLGETTVLVCELFTSGFCPWLKSVPNYCTRNNQRSGKCVRPKAIGGEECDWLVFLFGYFGVEVNKLI